MDYDSVNYNIEETNTELANYGSWSFMAVEGHSSNVVIRLNNTQNSNKNGLDGSGDESGCLSSTSSISEYSIHQEDTEPNTLLEVIDDKNKEIHQLKRINCNQKLQLNYYLKKNLINDTIATLGRSINLNALEEYDTINFSMARFNKANNRKSRLLRAYDKLNLIENKISYLLKRQENVLRKVTLDVLSSTAERRLVNANSNNNIANDKENTNGDGEYISYASQLDAFSKLLATTLSVKRELEHIKIYSRRIIVIEEERNSLVDYIYQLPVEQRLNGSYLLSVERKKAKLCMEMTNIRNDQRMLKEKISKLNHEEEYLKETAKELKARSVTVPKLIENSLLNEERTRLMNQIQDLQSEIQVLEDKIKYQDQNLKNYTENESKLIAAQIKCAALEHKVEILTRQKHELENELLNLSKLQSDYQELLYVNEALKKKLSGQRILEDEVCELRQKVKNFDSIMEERNKLKTQMEEYRSIQIVESSSDVDKDVIKKPDSFKELCNKINKIQDLESERERMKSKFDNLASALLQQDEQIKNLLNIFERFGDYKLNKKSSIGRNSNDKSVMNQMYLINFAKQIADKFNNSRIRDILLHKNLISKGHDDNNKVPEEADGNNNATPNLGKINDKKMEYDIKKLIENCPTVSQPTRLRNCSSNEALQSVFGPNNVGHTTKIIETGELLSKLNCHIESLEETTRGFCSKNVIKSKTSLQSSMLSIKNSEVDNSRDNLISLSENNADRCGHTESQIYLLDLPSQYGGEIPTTSSKSKLPVRASSVPPIIRKIHGKDNFNICSNKKSKFLTNVNSNITDNNLYSLMMMDNMTNDQKLKDLCPTAHGIGESNIPITLSKPDEKKKIIVPEAGDDLSTKSNPSSEVMLVDHRSLIQNKKTVNDSESDQSLKKNLDNNTKKLNKLHFNIQLNTNKNKVIGDLKAIQNQIETLDNLDNTDDLRNNFKKFYSKIFCENIDALN